MSAWQGSALRVIEFAYSKTKDNFVIPCCVISDNFTAAVLVHS